MDLIISGFTDFANIAIDNGAMTVEDGMKFMIIFNPDFKHDKLFNKIFPIIFRMEMCKRKINTEKKDEIDDIDKIDELDESKVYSVTI